MKVIAVVLVAILCGGCIVVGQGSMYGYVVAVEDSVVWSKVYFKTDLESSDADVFTIRKDNETLKQELEKFAESKERVKIKFKNHAIQATMDTSSEVVSVRLP